MPKKTALVLSAGAMFGAYQAGAWAVLAEAFQPDLIVGASVGALNAWAIAGGCSPTRLTEQWLDPALAAVTRFRLPLVPWHGVLDSEGLAAITERLYSEFRPRTEIGVVTIELPRLRPRIFRSPSITARHLAASCSILLGFRPVEIDGGVHADGGLLGALPLWAAAEMKATRVIAVHALPSMPSSFVRSFVKAVRFAAPKLPAPPPELTVLTIAPSQPMGSFGDLMFWRRENIERWIELGRRDALAARSTFLSA